MNANKGVLATLFAVLAFSAMLCQAQSRTPGAALTNPIGPETLLVAPRPEGTEVIAGKNDTANVVMGKKRKLLQAEVEGEGAGNTLFSELANRRTVVYPDNTVVVVVPTEPGERNATTLFPEGSDVLAQPVTVNAPAPEVEAVIIQPAVGNGMEGAAGGEVAGAGGGEVVGGGSTAVVGGGGATVTGAGTSGTVAAAGRRMLQKH